jgi:hypothetical protein
MNAKFEVTAKSTRIAVALVAVLCAALIGSGIDGLAGHYHSQAQMAAQDQVQATVAQR